MIIPLKFHYFYTTFPYFRSGHLSDRTFFVTSAVTRFSSLLSVIYKRQFICLSSSDTSFVHFIALFGKAATAPRRKLAFYSKNCSLPFQAKPAEKPKASTLLQFDSCILRLRLYRHINCLLYINFILLRKVVEKHGILRKFK